MRQKNSINWWSTTIFPQKRSTLKHSTVKRSNWKLVRNVYVARQSRQTFPSRLEWMCKGVKRIENQTVFSVSLMNRLFTNLFSNVNNILNWSQWFICHVFMWFGCAFIDWNCSVIVSCLFLEMCYKASFWWQFEGDCLCSSDQFFNSGL